MRSVLVATAAILGCAGASPDAGDPDGAGDATRYVSIGRDALDAALAAVERRGAPLDVVDLDADVAVLALDARDLGPLAEEIHALHDRCGGFVVHDSYAEARAAIPVHTDPNHADPTHGERSRPAVDYTLDRGAAVASVLPALEAGRILNTIGQLSSMQNRYYQSPSGAAASIWLRDRWRSLTTRRDVTVELFDHGYAQQSVILTIPGTRWPDEVVVIGGHLDSIAIGGASSTAPGADDDASGIATITEMARVLLARDYRPERTIQLMAYAAEEVGLRGSQLIVRDYQRRGVRVVGALQLDMTNYQGSEKDIWLMKDFTSAAQNAFLIALIESYVGASWGMDACGYACSDHASWHRAGVPASMPFESRSRDRNRAIHTRRDTLETSGDNAAHAVKFARLAAAYAVELGKGSLGTGDPDRPAPSTSPAPPGEAALRNRSAVSSISEVPSMSARTAPIPRAPSPTPGSPGHLGAALCVVVFLASLWIARAVADRVA